MNRRQLAVVLFLCAICWAHCLRCHALLWRQSPYVSWTATSADGHFIFANVSRRTISEQLQESNASGDELAAVEQTISDIRKRFPATGMYVNDGSQTPMWTTPLAIYRGIPSSDGKRLVALGEGAGSSTCFDLINVYEANGVFWEISKDDVVPLPETILRRLLGPTWEWYDTINVNPAGDRIVIGTDCRDVYEMSLIDRKVLRRHTLPNTLRIILESWRGKLAVFVLLAVMFAVVWQIGRWRNRWKKSLQST